jgi:hypothetical protein
MEISISTDYFLFLRIIGFKGFVPLQWQGDSGDIATESGIPKFLYSLE